MSILADRYASSAMREIWSAESKIRAERDLWIAIMRAQAKVGLAIPVSAIADYEKVKDQINLVSIKDREKDLRHDVKARIEEFNALAGHQYIHIALTSRDLTENIEMLQAKASLEILDARIKEVLLLLREKCLTLRLIPIVARTHNVPAQLTTLGRRFAAWSEELLFAYERFSHLRMRLPQKGIKGAVGTATDLIGLHGQDWTAVDDSLNSIFSESPMLIAPTQVYPRSIDFEVVSSIYQLCSPISNIALNIRLMAGHGLVSEFQGTKQVGSSAMPHKNNPRLSERVQGLFTILKGNLTMAAELAGNQWNEGDVTCSVTRRVLLPETFYLADAIFCTIYSVLEDLQIHEDAIAEEVALEQQFLLSSQILMRATQLGIGREVAHDEILKSAREARVSKGRVSFFDALANNPVINLSKIDILALNEEFRNLTGDTENQISKTVVALDRALADQTNLLKYPMPRLTN